MNITLDLGPDLPLDPGLRMRLRIGPLANDQLLDVCNRNELWRIEREPNGDLFLRPKVGGMCGIQTAALNAQLESWSERTGLGAALGSCCGMCLPNGAVRSPYAAWLRRDRWEALRPAERAGFLPFCADFVAEIVSPFDDRGELLDRMLEYHDNGAKLAWLIDPATRTVDIFRRREPVRSITEITHLMERQDEAAVLPGFVMDLRRIWNPGQ